MQHRRRTITLGIAAWTGALALTPAAGRSRPGDGGRAGAGARVAPRPRRSDWDPLTDDQWDFERRPGRPHPGRARTPTTVSRRPFEYAIVSKGPSCRRQHRRRGPARRGGQGQQPRRGPDLELPVPTRFYYAHFSQDNTIYPHNGIFVVDNADRPPDRRPVERLGGRTPRGHRRGVARRARALRRRDRRDRGVRRRGERAADDRHGHDVLAAAGSASARSTTSAAPGTSAAVGTERDRSMAAPRSPDSPSPGPDAGCQRRRPGSHRQQLSPTTTTVGTRTMRTDTLVGGSRSRPP